MVQKVRLLLPTIFFIYLTLQNLYYTISNLTLTGERPL